MNRMRSMKVSFVLGVVAALSGGGCGVPEEMDSGPDQGAVTDDGIDGTLLHRRELGPGHTVSFYDFGDGLVAIRESMPIDGGSRLFMKGMEGHGTLAEVYLKLNPGVAEVPARITAADGRARALEAGTVAREAPTPLATTSVAPTAALACSADVDRNSWGQDWFFINLCLGWPEDAQRACVSNVASAQVSGNYQWSAWAQMEGDHNVAGHIRGTYRRCGGIFCTVTRTIVDRPLPPRTIEYWEHSGLGDKVSWTGDSPCAHAHTAFKYRP
jgi:hypothetical protein